MALLLSELPLLCATAPPQLLQEVEVPQRGQTAVPEVSPESPNRAAISGQRGSEKFLHQTEPKRLCTRQPVRRTPPDYPTIWLRAPLPLYTRRRRVQMQLSDRFPEVQKFQGKPQTDRETVISSPPASL